jgi:hypothetical protein
MTVFYSLILWIGIVSLFAQDIKDLKKQNKIVVGFCSFGIFIIQAMRSNIVGIDLSSYLPAYKIAGDINVLEGEKIFNFEIGYIIYSQVFSKLKFSFQWYLAIVSLTIIIPIAFTWIRNSKIPGLSIFIYITLGFFTFSFSGLRQAIAIAITFFSFRYIQERNIVKFIICIGLASIFHTTAIIFSAAYPLYNIRLSIKHFFLIIPTIIITFIFRSKIYLLIYHLYNGAEGQTEATNAYTMLLVMIFVLVLSYVFGSNDKINLDFNAYKNYMIIAIFVQIFASQSSTIMRAGYYYYMFITLLIPEVIKNQRDGKAMILATYVLAVLLLYFFQINTGGGYLNVSPYHFYWE